jgi:uncharacterized protein
MPATEKRPFRALSLDGGGIKGVFTAAVLAVFEERTSKRTVDCFDLIAGTSTGGILAIGLGLGFPARDLLQFYIDRGGTIFPSTSRKRRLGFMRQLFAPKFSHRVLRAELEAILEQRKFADSLCPLVVPTYDAIGGRIYLMKTPHHPRFINEKEALAVDVALATSAAPTYFAAAPFPCHAGASYVDGGVWANCPALVALTEATEFFGREASDVDILSIGTTAVPFNIADQSNSGSFGWNVGIIELMFEAQVEAACAHAKLLSGGFHRINVTVAPGQFSLDKADRATIEQLAVHGRIEATKNANLAVAISRFYS